MTGSMLNARQKKAGFYFLLASGIADIILYLKCGWYGKMFFCILKNLISVFGLITWTKKERENKR